MLSSQLALLATFAAGVVGAPAVDTPAKIRFEGHQVVRCNASPSTVDALRAIATANPSLDWWTPPESALVGRPIDVHVAPTDGAILSEITAAAGGNCTVMIPDIQTLIDTENNPSLSTGARGRRQADDPWTWGYHEYDEIIRHFLVDVVPKHAGLASSFSIGKSYEGREQIVVRITGGDHTMHANGTAAPNALPAFWMEALIHAREWITGASMYWVIEAILEQYGADPEITRIVDSMDLYFLLVTNPDGYVFTHNSNRMWRKTRSPNAGTSCIGTDPNRNWDYSWCTVGASRDPCQDTYCGPSPASAAEVAQVQAFVGNHGNVVAFIDFHAYSQLWLTPWGWTSALPPRADYEEQQACAKAATDALTRVHGTRYTYGPVSTTIYPASGSSLDWAYGAHDIKLAFGPEGRDLGQYGFLLPWTQIVPSGQENLAAVLATAKFALENPHVWQNRAEAK